VKAASTLASSLRTLADLADVRGAASDGSDLRRAAHIIDALPTAAAGHAMHEARLDGLRNEPGIAASLRPLIRTLAMEGPANTVRSAQAGLPSLFARLLESRIIGTEEAAGLVRQLGILTLADLQTALGEGRVRQSGGSDLERLMEQAASDLEAGIRPIPLGRAADLLHTVAADISASSAAIDLVTPAGDVRRFESLVQALAIVARASDPPSAIDAICAMPSVEDVRHRSGRRALLAVQHAEIDVRVAAPDEYGTFLFHATGSPAHLNAMHQRGGPAVLTAREEAVYAHAGLPFIAPELRESAGEIDAAASGRLPSLITREHIRGDLHMHTTYSDGADTLDAMVGACCRLGYEYIAITDHSERASASRTLTRSDISRQRDAIEVMRARYPGITILHGVEADIMPNGSLDFPDRILESLDIVLASLHDAARHDANRLTRRCIQAIRHPLVTIVTHPANRLVGRREGYRLDFDAVYAAAAETGTALEVDGAPSHLDLDGAHARAAVAAGVTLAVDSDCHRARALARQMELGIGTARRGWVEPRHVLNTRSIDDVRAFIAAKRARR
jgi:DNA polymerase (family 10)